MELVKMKDLKIKKIIYILYNSEITLFISNFYTLKILLFKGCSKRIKVISIFKLAIQGPRNINIKFLFILNQLKG
jgi:hypothetical protein